jgi:sterol desaturase/sphingolipid hydroxylase (fatty acid hydroxylase superfamily)
LHHHLDRDKFTQARDLRANKTTLEALPGRAAMDILGWIRDQWLDFLSLGPLLQMFASGDYRSLLTVDGFGSLVAPIIPLLLLFELVRGIVLRRVKREDYQVPLLVMVLNNFIGAFVSIAMISFCIGLFNRFAPFQAGLTWYGLLYGYVVWELAHFVYHFFAHKVRLLWCLHSTHHAPVAMNLSVNYAHIFLEGTYADFVRTSICMLLGVSPPLLVLIMIIDGFWGSFIHLGENVWREGKMGVFYRVLLTPSHHRVHHARNVLYMDTNFCNLLPIWDRIFGTYMEVDKDTRIEYGITRPVKPYSVLDAYLGEIWLLAKDVWHAQGLRNKLFYLMMPPGWSHDGDHHTAKAAKAALLMQQRSGVHTEQGLQPD